MLKGSSRGKLLNSPCFSNKQKDFPILYVRIGSEEINETTTNIFQDITRRRRTTTKLNQQEELLRKNSRTIRELGKYQHTHTNKTKK